MSLSNSKRREGKNIKLEKKKKKSYCCPRSQHGSSTLFHTHKSDQLKMEMHYTLDKQFQTLIKADLGMCINNNLHLVMFRIWTLNVLGEANKKISNCFLEILMAVQWKFRVVMKLQELSAPNTISFVWYLSSATCLPLFLKFHMKDLIFFFQK